MLSLGIFITSFIITAVLCRVITIKSKKHDIPQIPIWMYQIRR